MRRSFTADFMLLLTLLNSAGSSWLQAADMIDTKDVGSRGVVFESPQGNFGISAGKGVDDVNGDGFDDVALLVRMLPSGTPNSSALVLLYGGPALSGRKTIRETLPRTAFFRTLDPELDIGAPSPAGDINQDGFADVSVPLHPIDGNLPNTVFLVYGAPDLTGEHEIEDIGVTLAGMSFFSSDDSILGIQSVVPIGDFNGDGSVDVAIGAPRSTNLQGEAEGGAIFVLFDVRKLSSPVDLSQVGSTIPGFRIYSTTSPNPACCLIGSQECCNQPCCGRFGSGLGDNIRPLGDFDGDGFDDLLVSASGLRPRRFYLIRGRAQPPAVVDLVEAEARGEVITFLGHVSSLRDNRALGGIVGEGMAGLGDLDGDGLPDLALAVTRECCPSPLDTGIDVATYIFSGRSDFPSRIDFNDLSEEDYSAVIRSTDPYTRFGSSLAAEDMNQDGMRDLVIGAPDASPGGKSNAGEAYVVYGRGDLPKELLLDDDFDGLRVLGDGYFNGLGSAVDGAGDFNGDGTRDVLLLAPQRGTQYPGPARACVIYGTGSGPIPLRLYRADPAFGPLRGGTVLRLRGSGFTGIAGEPRVLFGGNPASSARVISGSEIRAVTPPGDGTGPVDVTLILGAETRTVAQGFKYTPDFPAIDIADLGNAGLVLEGEQTPDGIASPGSSVAFGDFTDDGVDDLAVGSQTPRGGIVTLVRGGPGLPPKLPPFASSDRVSLITFPPAVENAPVHVAAIGDVNGDGVGDLGVGLAAGLAYVIFGRASFPRDLVLEDELFERRAVRLEASGDSSDVKLARLGDATGDGIGDFAVSIPRASRSDIEVGEIVVIAGRTVWPDDFDLDASALTLARIQGSRAGERLGEEIATAGDVNGDGALDLIAATLGVGGSGRAYVLFGGTVLSGETTAESHTLAGGGVTIVLEDGVEQLNWLHVVGAGDTDADGFDDVLLGVEGGGASNQGVTYLLRGAASLPQSLTLVEEPAALDGIARFFGSGPWVQSGRIAPAGDFNADGRDDFLIAQLPDKPLDGYPWKVLLMLGGDDLPSSVDLSRVGSFGLELPGPNAAQVFLPAREAGDLNGDGQPDFAITGGKGGFDGKPGSVYVVFGAYGGTTFRRADANFDGRIEISDAIYALSYLFLGGEVPRCKDAVDADDDGRLVLTDAVYLLNHLFAGGPEPPVPYPNKGMDPTQDTLDCRGF